ncbi:MAG: DUF2267 domain-containing protein [Ilumatobacteraceae bacterium]
MRCCTARSITWQRPTRSKQQSRRCRECSAWSPTCTSVSVAATHARRPGEPSIVGAILATFAERIPQDEREHVATHLPADVRSMFTPPRRLRRLAPVRTVPDLVARIAADTEVLPNDKAVEVTRAVISELRALVPDEVADVAATLPRELRDLWNQ